MLMLIFMFMFMFGMVLRIGRCVAHLRGRQAH